MQKQIWGVGVRELYGGYYRIRVQPMNIANPFYMKGTEETGEYVVVATAPGDSSVIWSYLTRDLGWKQPGDGNQLRFSTVVKIGEHHFALALALKAVGTHKAGAKVNPGTTSVPNVIQPLAKMAEIVGVKFHPRTAKATVTLRVRHMVKAVSEQLKVLKAKAAQLA